MKHPLSRLWRLPPLSHRYAMREEDAPSARSADDSCMSWRPLRGGAGLCSAGFKGSAR